MNSADSNTARHTPGPWELDDEMQVCARNAIIARVGPASMLAGSITEADANAVLIAAAPDLLRALEELVAMVRGECPSLLNEDSGGNARLDLAIDAAIAKARGSLSATDGGSK